MPSDHNHRCRTVNSVAVIAVVLLVAIYGVVSALI